MSREHRARPMRGGSPGGAWDAFRRPPARARRRCGGQPCPHSPDHRTIRAPRDGAGPAPALELRELRPPFVELETDLEDTERPEEMLAVAAADVGAARELFQHLERALARTLIGVDERREGGALPSLLGGLRSDLIQQAAAEQR